MILSIILLGGLMGIGIIFIERRIDRLNRLMQYEIRAGTKNIINQLDGLMAVYAEIRPDRALPRGRGWAASPDFLALIIRIVHPSMVRTVVECSSGYSTLVLAACMRNQTRGHVYSLEHDPVYAKKTRELLLTHNLQDWATVIDAPLVHYSLPGWSGLWYKLDDLPRGTGAEVIVVDGPPKSTGQLARYPAVPLLLEYMADEACIVLDDADRPDEVTAVQRWLKETVGMSLVESGKMDKGYSVLSISKKVEASITV